MFEFQGSWTELRAQSSSRSLDSGSGNILMNKKGFQHFKGAEEKGLLYKIVPFKHYLLSCK